MTMDFNIGRISASSSSVTSNNYQAAKKDENKEEQAAQVNVGAEESLTKSFPNALEIQGSYNQIQITKPVSKEVNPSDYLTEDRIADIEAMMGKFEDGVGVVADAIDDELPGFFAEDAKLALAAKIFAQE